MAFIPSKIGQVNRLWFVLFALFLTSGCKSAVRSIEIPETNNLFSEIIVNAALAEVDKLGNLYVVTDKNVLIKYDKNNFETYRYANKRSGRITHLDVSNPLKILLFFDDFNYLLVLDATLTEVTDLQIEDFGLADITAAAIANDDNYWVYDPVQFRLLKINQRGTLITESSNTNDFGMESSTISRIRESGNFVILCDTTRGFYIFDNLGQYVRFIPAEDIKYFRFDGRLITFATSQACFSLNLNLGEIAVSVIYDEINPGITIHYVIEQATERIILYKDRIIRTKK